MDYVLIDNFAISDENSKIINKIFETKDCNVMNLSAANKMFLSSLKKDKTLVFAGVKFNNVSEGFISLLNKLGASSFENKIDVVIVAENSENTKFVIEWLVSLTKLGKFNINILAEFGAKDLEVEVEALKKAINIASYKEKVITKIDCDVSDRVEIYTDGACSGNPGPGGWAAVFVKGDKTRELSGFEPHSTNNRMEITAVIKALAHLKRPTKVLLYSDSAYVVNAINNNWIEHWKHTGWKNSEKIPVKNMDLWQELDELMKIHEVEFCKVKGHSDVEYNNRCDKLANLEITKNFFINTEV